MKLLFVCFEYYGKMDAGSRCIQHLRTELLRQMVQSDVLTYDWAGKAPQIIKDTSGTVYTAKTWYRYARLHRNNAGKIQMSPLQWAKAAVTRGYAILTEGKNYAHRGVPVNSTYSLQKRLASLCTTNKYDWIISVSYPFSNHLAVLKACPSECKIALYNLDPYWNNLTYDSRDRISRAKEEVAAYKKANLVFCTPEQLSDYQNDFFSEVRQKITPLNYPNFVPPCIEQAASIQFDPEKINLLFLGTIYSDIRKPDALFQLFEQVSQLEPRLHLYVIGKKFGENADRYLVEYQSKMKDRLTVCSPVPPEETADLMRQADILVNLGNTMHNQMPSKLLEYIATGKPILNISAREDCNTLSLMNRYPLGLQIFSTEPFQKERTEDFLRFCANAKKRVLTWEELETLYEKQLLSAVCSGFLNALSASAKGDNHE